MAFYVSASDVKWSENKRSITFTLHLESHAIIKGGDGRPTFHRFAIPGVRAWRGLGGKIAVDPTHDLVRMNPIARKTVATVLSQMPSVREMLRISAEVYDPAIQEAYTGTAKRMFMVGR